MISKQTLVLLKSPLVEQRRTWEAIRALEEAGYYLERTGCVSVTQDEADFFDAWEPLFKGKYPPLALHPGRTVFLLLDHTDLVSNRPKDFDELQPVRSLFESETRWGKVQSGSRSYTMNELIYSTASRDPFNQALMFFSWKMSLEIPGGRKCRYRPPVFVLGAEETCCGGSECPSSKEASCCAGRCRS